ncbi:hypothetical protein [Phascolarctobacterium faecium]|jgi:hypothetical protein
MEAQIKDIEGAKIDDYMSFRFWQGKWDISVSAKSPRAKYFADFDLDGNLKKFKKN